MTNSTSTAPTPTSRRLPAWTTSFGVQILAALVLGLALGLLARSMGHTEETPTGLGTTLEVIGSSYVSLLRATVVPLPPSRCSEKLQ